MTKTLTVHTFSKRNSHFWSVCFPSENISMMKSIESHNGQSSTHICWYIEAKSSDRNYCSSICCGNTALCAECCPNSLNFFCILGWRRHCDRWKLLYIYYIYIYMYNNCHCSLHLSNVKMCEYLQKKPSNSVFTLTKKHFNLIFHKS